MRKAEENLRIPGPTPLPSQVLKSLTKQMINHRGGKYEEMHSRIISNLRYFYQTSNEILLLTSSGMGGLESAIVNFFSRGERVAFFTCGEFGNRWAEIGRRYGLEILHEKMPIGRGFDHKKVSSTLEKADKVKGVFITLNETSTGVLNPVKQIAESVRKNYPGSLFLVDAISALGAVNLPMDDAGIDVIVSASQKAWMSPPGLAMVAVSPKAWESASKSNLPKYYFDLKSYKEYNLKNQTPATPAVSTLYGLDTALSIMRKEGKDNIFRRHVEMRDYVRDRIRKEGFELYVEDQFASPTVTSVKIPPGTDSHKWITTIREKYNTVIAGGMGESKGKIIRIAHMGNFSKKNLNDCIDAVSQSYKALK